MADSRRKKQRQGERRFGAQRGAVADRKAMKKRRQRSRKEMLRNAS